MGPKSPLSGYPHAPPPDEAFQARYTVLGTLLSKGALRQKVRLYLLGQPLPQHPRRTAQAIGLSSPRPLGIGFAGRYSCETRPWPCFASKQPTRLEGFIGPCDRLRCVYVLARARATHGAARCGTLCYGHSMTGSAHLAPKGQNWAQLEASVTVHESLPAG